MGSHSVNCHPVEVRIRPLLPAEAGTRFNDPRGMQGWVDLCYIKVDRLGFEPATCQSQVQRRTGANMQILTAECLSGHPTKTNSTKKTWQMPWQPTSGLALSFPRSALGAWWKRRCCPYVGSKSLQYPAIYTAAKYILLFYWELST